MQKRVTINIIGHKEETSVLKRFLDNSIRKQGRKHPFSFWSVRTSVSGSVSTTDCYRR